MIISRHIRYIDNPEVCIRQELVFDPPVDVESTLGRSDADIYRGIEFRSKDFPGPWVKPIIHEDGILHIREPMAIGEIVSIELRQNHILDSITFDDRHNLQLLLWENLDDKVGGFIYWLTCGKDGILEVQAKLKNDRDGYYQKLKSNIRDLPYREYLVKKAVSQDIIEPVKESDYPHIMDNKMAASYLGIAVSTLYKISPLELPRTAQGRFRKKDLNDYLEKTMKR